MKTTVAIVVVFLTGALVGRWTAPNSRRAIHDTEPIISPSIPRNTLGGLQNGDGVQQPKNAQTRGAGRQHHAPLSDNSDFRESITRELALDYAEFVHTKYLDRRIAALLNELLVSDHFAKSQSERLEVSRLIEELLGPGLAEEYLEYRKMLPRQNAARRVTTEFKSKFPDANTSSLAAAEHIARSISPANAVFDRLRVQATFTDADILEVEREHRTAVEHAISKTRSVLTDQEAAYLRDRILESGEMKEQVRILRLLLTHQRGAVP